jgi:hypothetical protein
VSNQCDRNSLDYKYAFDAVRGKFMLVKNLEFPRDKIADFCQRWQSEELAFFGSVLRDDFRPDRDGVSLICTQ